jgi:putative ABC transport system permease protein
VSLFIQLPLPYRPRIASVEGVESVSPWTWFGAWHRDESEFFAQFAVDLAVLFDQYPEVVVPEEQKARVLSERRGALVGSDLADQFGWKVGDLVPLTSRIYPPVGGGAWEFEVSAIYESTKPNIDEKTMFFHDEYFQEMIRESLGDVAAGANVYMVKMAPGYRSEDVAAAIDAIYEGGPQRTRTQTEQAFQAQFVSMMGNIPVFLAWIGGAVLFAIFFSVLNTSQMSARERSRDVGILKALGFRDAFTGRLLLLESVVMVGAGGIVGTFLGLVSQPMFRRMFGTQVPNYFVAPATVLVAVAVALAIGVFGGFFPALRLARLRPVDVFRQEG